jgi:uncharacterized protein
MFAWTEFAAIAIGVIGLWSLYKYGNDDDRSGEAAAPVSEKTKPKSTIQHAAALLKELFEKHRIPETHGYNHAIAVLMHARKAVDSFGMLFLNEKIAVELAALLHDADDKKYFPHNRNYENARHIVKTIGSSAIEERVIEMISYVSASANKNNIPDNVRLKPWVLYPRWADRLEAAGWVGVIRAWEYTKEIGHPLFTDETPKAKTEEELWKIATPERYAAYSGNSISMIDHYYDKLLHICKFQTDNEYLLATAKARLGPLITVCLAYGERGEDALAFILRHAGICLKLEQDAQSANLVAIRSEL